MRSRNHSDFDRLWMAAGKKIKEREYWLGKLSGELVKSSFPTTYEDKVAGDGEGSEGLDIDVNVVNFTFGNELSQGLLKLSTGSDVRLHIVLTAVLILLLGKYSGNTDIIVGTPVLKTGSDVELLNTVLAIRNQLPPDITFKELLLQVRQTMIEADEHGDYPIELVVHQLNLPVYSDGEGGDFPLFDVAIMMENIHDKQYLSHVNPRIIFSFLRTQESIRGHVEYRALCYHPRTIERIVGHFQHLVEKVLSDVEIRVSDIEWLLPEEKQQILFDFNDTGEEYPRDKNLREMFAEQVEQTPDQVALVGTKLQNTNYKLQTNNKLQITNYKQNYKISITYRELNEKSQQLAHLLRQKSVQPGTIVAIMVERSLEMIIGLLAILKIGSAYLPIDPDYPEDRIDYMLKD
ncbi:MAG: AMP-binding protein, partial [Candidatus Aminicenantes bacterium]